MLFIHWSINLDVFVGDIGNIPVGVEFSGSLGEDSSSSSFFFVATELNKKTIYPFCSLWIALFVNLGGKIVRPNLVGGDESSESLLIVDSLMLVRHILLAKLNYREYKASLNLMIKINKI